MLVGGCSDSSVPPKTAVVPTPVDPATAGSIHVEVTYAGNVPPPKLVEMHSAPLCAAAHTEPVYDQSLLVQGGRVANAVVWIKQGLETWVFAPPTQPVVVDQRGCIYEPHVATCMVSQPAEFRNSDREAHNVHGHPQVVSGWNFLLARQNATRSLSFDKPEVAVQVGCDIHPWMRGYIAVTSHPYVAVTPADGTVTLRQVPPGQYVLAVWHETLGTKEEKITLEPRGTVRLQFPFGGG